LSYKGGVAANNSGEAWAPTWPSVSE